jgi:hypothetical protein
MRCSKCSNSCGDDFKTKTKYAEEDNLGDCLKVVLLQVYDMLEVHNLQKSEIKILLKNLVDEHIEEFDEVVEKPYKQRKKKKGKNGKARTNHRKG